MSLLQLRKTVEKNNCKIIPQCIDNVNTLWYTIYSSIDNMELGMELFLRFVIVSPESDMQHGHSRDFLAATKDEAGLSETAVVSQSGHKLIEDLDGIWGELPGLAGYALEADGLTDALKEIQTMSLPYGDLSQRCAIYSGHQIETLAFGDGVVFEPTSILFDSEAV